MAGVEDDDSDYCSYTLSVDDYHESLSAEWPDHDPTPLADLPTTDGEWRCPRRTADDRCVLHDEDADDAAVAAAVDRALAGEVTADDLRPGVADPVAAARRFVGLTADALDLSRRRLPADGTAPVDLRRADVETLDLSETRVTVPLWLDGATVDRLHAPAVSTAGDFRCRFATLGTATLPGADVDGRVSLRFATVDGVVDVETVTADGRLDLGFATVTGPVRAERATCRGRFTMKEATAASVAARHLAVGGTDPESSYPGVQVRGLETDGDVDLRDCDCDGTLIGYAVVVGGDLDLSGATVTDGVSMGGGTTDLVEATVDGVFDCSEATIGDAFTLSGRDEYETNPTVGEQLVCRAATFDRVDLAPALTADAVGVVDLRSATVEAGELGQPTDAEAVVYDLQHATLGDVTLAAGDRPAPTVVRFDRTAFDGFRFGESRAEFADRDWAIYDLPDGVRRRIAVGRQYDRAADLAGDLATLCAVQPGTRSWLREHTAPYDPAALAAIALDSLDDERVERVARNGPETADVLGERVFERERYREGVVTYLAREALGEATVLRTLLAPPGADDGHSDRGATAVGGTGADDAGDALAALADAVETADAPGGAVPDAVETARERLATAFARTLADEHPVESRPDHAETTYIMARKGADDVGDTVVAGELFVNELRYRRRRHHQRARSATGAEKWRARGRFLANALFDAVAVYGEHPRRVFGVSVATVVGMAGLYWLAWLALPEFDATTYGGPGGAVLLSLESFTSLVLGGGGGVEAYPVRVLAGVESFLGAFLIALFVFALTRSLKR